MAKKLIAFHGDPTIKAKYIARVKAHAAADQIIQGVYWENGKGCACGCTIHGSDHSKYEKVLGIPVQLAYIEDGLFEALENGEAKRFPLQFLNAIPVGADLSLVHKKFLVWTLVDKTWGVVNCTDKPDVIAVINGMAALMKRSLKGDDPSEAEWNDAEQAAWDAWDAWAARAAWAARDAWDARAARTAWDAKANEFTVAAKKKLLSLLRNAPVESL